MINIVQLQPWHIASLHSDGYIPDEVFVEGYCEYLCSAGHSVAVINNGRVVGAGGIVHLWGSVGEGWTFISDWLRRNPIALVKAFKAFFKDCPKYKRLQITVVEGFEKAEAFAEYLGFTPEGRMMYYSPTGETHTRYARIN